MNFDKVSEDENIFISGIFSMRAKEALQRANITHVLSVLRLSPDLETFKSYQHMRIDVDDVEDENLLEHFPESNAFIQRGLNEGGGVLVHCAMGKSRSATCVIAYLMKKHRLSPQEALAQIRRYRPICEPNDGFMKQLEVYYEMSCDDQIDENPVYQRWLYKQEVEMSIACGKAPDHVRFEDEHGDSKQAEDERIDIIRLSCRKCRQVLATSQYIVAHEPGAPRNRGRGKSSDGNQSTCAHYFLEPLSWMRPELEHAKMDGRLECPKCQSNVGKYAWQGMECSCGSWVVPGISLAKGRVDEIKSRTGPGRKDGLVVQPPGSSSASRGKGAGPPARKGIL